MRRARTMEQTILSPPIGDLPINYDPIRRPTSDARTPAARCGNCGSSHLNWLGDCCRRCGTSISDPAGEYTETASF